MMMVRWVLVLPCCCCCRRRHDHPYHGRVDVVRNHDGIDDIVDKWPKR